MKTNTNILKGLTIVLIAFMLYSCNTGEVGLPARKKMPEFTSYDGIEVIEPFGNHREAVLKGGFTFASSNVDLMVNGNMHGFVSVQMPDPITDSAAICVVNTAKPLALPILTNWAKQQRNGVMIDLSSHGGGEIHRTDYVLEKQDSFSIPIVVMWDQNSSERVILLKNTIQGIPSVKLSCVSGNDPGINHIHNINQK